MLKGIEAVMMAIGLSVMAALLVEYGFGWAPVPTSLMHGAEFFAAYVFCGLQTAKLFFVPAPFRYLAKNWLAFALVFLMLFQLVAGLCVEATAEYRYLINTGNKLPLASISLAFVQCYFLAVAAMESTLLHRLLLRLQLSPAPLLATSFALLILAGTAALKLPLAAEAATRLSWLDALFTATSAACVTGLATVDPGTSLSALGQFVLLCLIQLGGLGILSFTAFMAIFSGEGLRESASLKALFDTDSQSELRTFLLRLFAVTFVVEGAGAFLLYNAMQGQVPDPFLRVFHALFHSVSAFCNAGFSLYRDSLSAFITAPAVLFVMMGLMLAGAIGYPVLIYLPRTLSRAVRGKFSKVSSHIKVVLLMNMLLVAAGAALFLFFENSGTLRGLSASAKFNAALFMPITARTTGFQLFDLGGLGLFAILLMVALMFIGGAPASASGGIKVTAVAVLWAKAHAGIRGTGELELGGEKIGDSLFAKATAIAALLIGLAGVASLLLWLLEPQPYVKTLFEAVSAVNTVGLSMGITPSLAPASKLILILCMFLGRIGPVLIVVSFNASRPHKKEPILLG